MFRCMVFSTFTSMYKWDRPGSSALCWNTLLQCSHMDMLLLQQKNIEKKKKNYKGLKITACIGSWGKLWTIRQKKTKKPTTASEVLGATTASVHDPCTWHHQGLVDHLSHPSGPTPGLPPPSTHLRDPLTPLKEQAREVVTCFCCLLLQPKSQ